MAELQDYVHIVSSDSEYSSSPPKEGSVFIELDNPSLHSQKHLRTLSQVYTKQKKRRSSSYLTRPTSSKIPNRAIAGGGVPSICTGSTQQQEQVEENGPSFWKVIQKVLNFKDFILYSPRGQIALGTAILLAIVFLGALVFTVTEGWSYNLALYFMVTTVTTVGLGDVVPHTNAGKVVLIMFGVLAVAVVMFVLTSISEKISNDVDTQLCEQRTKLLTFVRKKFNHLKNRGKRAIHKKKSHLHPKAKISSGEQDVSDTGMCMKTIHVNGEGEEEEEEQDEGGSKISRTYKFVGGECQLELEQPVSWQGRLRKFLQFRFYTMILVLSYVGLLFGGSVCFYWAENNFPQPYQHHNKWNYLDALYFTFTVVTTIGYGDFSPSTHIGRIVYCLFALASLGLMGLLFSDLGHNLVKLNMRRAAEAKRKRTLHCKAKVDAVMGSLWKEISDYHIVRVDEGVDDDLTGADDRKLLAKELISVAMVLNQFDPGQMEALLRSAENQKQAV